MKNVDMEMLKEALFEIYSAGYEAGMQGEQDLATAFNDWFEKNLLKRMPPSPYVS